MEVDFWQQRWREGQIGFHLQEVNPLLRMYWPLLRLPQGARVLVPLCGKSRDLAWLAAQGYQVIGVELSSLAVNAFFEEQRLCPVQQAHGQHSGHYVDGIEIWCGDFFDLHPSQVGQVDAIYDRAALIALPEAMRGRYVQQLLALAGAVPQLLITLDYPQDKMAGPPFAVSTQEVTRLYGRHYPGIAAHVCYDALGSNARFIDQGLSRMAECVYLLGT
jgi:thiopurine S-methyltransferase